MFHIYSITTHTQFSTRSATRKTRSTQSRRVNNDAVHGHPARSGRRRTKSVPGTPGFRPGTSALVPVLDAGTEESEIQLAKDDTVACTEPASLDVGSGGVHSSQGSIIWSPQTSQRPRLPSALARRAPRSALPYEYCMRTSNKIHVPHARTDYVTPHFAAQRAQAAREHNNSFSHSAPVAARQPERASSPAPGATSAAWRGRVVGSAATHRLTHSLQQLPFLLPRAAWPHARKASVSQHISRHQSNIN